MNPTWRALFALPVCALTLLAGPARSDEPPNAAPPAASAPSPYERGARAADRGPGPRAGGPKARRRLRSGAPRRRRPGSGASARPPRRSTGSRPDSRSAATASRSTRTSTRPARTARASGKTNEWDYLRAVVYLGWKFDRTFVLNTEIEYEHASTGKGGEVSVEFATLDAMLRDEVNLRAGLVLVPVGFVNEMHEPTTYLGARRPDTENRILPSTWRANGIGAFGEAGPVAYKLYLTESLNASSFTAANGIRGGRQKRRAGDGRQPGVHGPSRPRLGPGSPRRGLVLHRANRGRTSSSPASPSERGRRRGTSTPTGGSAGSGCAESSRG